MPPLKKDAVHRYFDYEETNNHSQCRLCKKKIKGKHTSNLKNHLSVKHVSEYNLVNEINQEHKKEKNKDNKIKETTTRNAEILKHICTKLITVHGRPLALIEDDAFQELLNIAASGDGGIMSQLNIKNIKSMIVQQANIIREKIWKEIKNKLVCLKLDGATCNERKFIGINIQYIKNAEIVVRNLAVVEVHQPQTATFLKETLEEILMDFRITFHNIYCTCTDNGANMIKLVKLIGGEYEHIIMEEERENMDDEVFDEEITEIEEVIETGVSGVEEDLLYSDPQIRGMLCAAHTLQLAIKDAFNNDVESLTTVNLARKIVNILRKPRNLDKLKAAGLNKPINDCLTRWTSTFNMLKRLKTFEEICDTLPDVSILISREFWEELSRILECLKPVNLATLQLQQHNLTIGDFYITWLNCKNQIQLIDHNLARSLFQAMETRETKLLNNDVVLECLYMDRRLNVILNEQQIEKAKNLLKETYEKIKKINNNNENNEVIVQHDEPRPSTSTGLAALEVMLATAEREKGIFKEISSFDGCLNELIGSPRLPLTENILKSWSNAAVSSSDLAMVANTVLAAPATQVSVERLFSSLKFILNPLRSNLNAYFLRDVMLIRENKQMLDY